MNPELEWLDGSLNGDRRSQKAFFEQWYPYAWSVCNCYAYSREDAEEMVADGFIRMFSNLHIYDAKRPFKSWFRIILVHSALNHLKKKKEFYGKIEELNDQQSPEPDALSRLSYDELLHAIGQLPPVYRTVMMLYAVEGWNHSDIAIELGIRESTSRSNLLRARASLTKWIKVNYKEKIEGNG